MVTVQYYLTVKNKTHIFLYFYGFSKNEQKYNWTFFGQEPFSIFQEIIETDFSLLKV